MAEDVGRKRGGKPSRLEGAVKSATVQERGLSLVLRLKNSGDRALHYICEVRGIKYDPAARKLTVMLSDAGRVLVTAPSSRAPKMNSIDPNSEAELALELPPTIVKLAAPPAPPGSFEEHHITEATDIEVNVSWADTPYYEDPRPSDDKRSLVERWKQAELQIAHKMSPPGVR